MNLLGVAIMLQIALLMFNITSSTSQHKILPAIGIATCG